ncbi:hypothetical protein KUTeg_012488 [Tegillarca granosa]|uniref:Hemicentin-1 n=1 Tax=Tegillarca granosa TaxID=220873 RepID=A0ABQ9EZP8_TEGGR|nr:hypothetical protein KUTeg_012488 [Tegillarca granosa]
MVLSEAGVDGGWTSWGSWGTCSKSCGGGSQSRSRSCTNPAPQYGGANCAGSSSSSQACNTHNCPIHGNWATWAAWGTCTVTCGGGSQTRSRTCSNPTPQYGGNTCSGSVDGGWDAWSTWTTCTVTCGGGTQSRTRGCNSPAPQYGGAYCGGSSFDLQACNTQNCPIDGVWTSWTSWSVCTVTCGGGTQDKTRTCTDPAPQHGGADCPGNSSDRQDCNTQVCIIDGAWGSWSSWGTCTVTCGTGRQSRSRVCDDPRPANGGLNCTGDSGEYQDCNNQTCPVAAAGQYVQLCPSGWFTCESGAMTCINMMFVCDCDSDCDDGSDETTTYAGCSATILAKCPSGVDHISVSIVSMVMCLLVSLFALLR